MTTTAVLFDHQLLTAEQEVALAQEMTAGKAAQLQLDAASTSMELLERRRLERTASRGARAREELITRNVRLVRKTAAAFDGRGVEYEDLVQEGISGLITAVDRFDPARGFKLSTYAVHWIRQAIARAVGYHSRTIRLPMQVHDELTRVAQSRGRLAQSLNREPTAAEVAADAALTEERIAELAEHGRPTLSLQSPLGEDDLTLGDVMPGGIDPSQEVESGTLAAEAPRVLDAAIRDVLDFRQADMVRRRYGLAGYDEHTYTEIGRAHGVGPERARQIVIAAEQLLRAAAAPEMRDYIAA